MKRHIILTYFACLVFIGTKEGYSQTYVTIPDANFVSWLNNNIPSAMNGNLMNITSTAVTTTHSIDIWYRNITNLQGIQYFTSLTSLDCHYNNLTALPSLPNSLQVLICHGNLLISLPALPSSLRVLNCGGNQLSSLPILPSSLKILLCFQNKLANLPALPSSLEVLACYNNVISNIPSLPSSLLSFNCSFNSMSTLPILPNSVGNLACAHNQITDLPIFPDYLDTLECNDNKIICFPNFPVTMNYVKIYDNPFICLPNYIPALANDTVLYPLCGVGNSSGCVVNPAIVFIPNVFTPNGDNINDDFFINCKYVIDFHCKILGRWGELVYEWTDSSKGWNGKSRSGVNCSDGTYYYQVTYTDNRKKPLTKSGFLLLTR